MKPTLKVLQEFSSWYFSTRPPRIRWKKMDADGQAYRGKNVIYLKPGMSTVCEGCKVGSRAYYKARQTLKLKEGEQYFLVLLHEIAHFKIIMKPLKEWVILKRKLMKEARERLRHNKRMHRRLGKKPMTKKEEKRALWDCVYFDAYLKRRKWEREDKYQGRNENFRSWLYGDIISEHMNVEDWARKEFVKQRKIIRGLLTKR